MPHIYGYARCSTNEQKQDIERQIHDLEAMGATNIFSEYGSGIDFERPEFKTLQESIKPGDTIVVTELSRLTRSVHQLCHILEVLADGRAVLKVGDFTADCSEGLDPMVEGMFLMMSIFAQLERKLTIQRIKSGVEHARSKGVRLGRPPMTKEKLPEAFKKHLPDYQAGKLSKTEFARLCGCSRPSLYHYLKVFLER